MSTIHLAIVHSAVFDAVNFVANTRWWPPSAWSSTVVAAIIVGEITAGMHFGEARPPFQPGVTCGDTPLNDRHVDTPNALATSSKQAPREPSGRLSQRTNTEHAGRGGATAATGHVSGRAVRRFA